MSTAGIRRRSRLPRGSRRRLGVSSEERFAAARPPGTCAERPPTHALTRRVPMPTKPESASTYEAENQQLLSEYGLSSVTVVRDQHGKILQASGEYPDGTQEIVYHSSPRSSPPAQAHVSS